jgi:small subunit ribosomal protein S20
MAITKGAKKAHRASLRKRVFNVRRKNALTDATKAVKKALAAGKKAEAEKLLSDAYQAIDKAAKRGVIKANAAARKKSRLVAAIKRAA